MRYFEVAPSYDSSLIARDRFSLSTGSSDKAPPLLHGCGQRQRGDRKWWLRAEEKEKNKKEDEEKWRTRAHDPTGSGGSGSATVVEGIEGLLGDISLSLSLNLGWL